MQDNDIKIVQQNSKNNFDESCGQILQNTLLCEEVVKIIAQYKMNTIHYRILFEKWDKMRSKCFTCSRILKFGDIMYAFLIFDKVSYCCHGHIELEVSIPSFSRYTVFGIGRVLLNDIEPWLKHKRVSSEWRHYPYLTIDSETFKACVNAFFEWSAFK